MRRVGISIAVAGLALVSAVPSASATANRPEYQAQVNEICANANREQERIVGVLIRKLKRAEKKQGGSGEIIFFTERAVLAAKKKGKPKPETDPLTRIFNHYNRLLLAVEDSELASLVQIAAAPGDEALVADWLRSRELQNRLYREAIHIEARIEKLFRANLRTRKEVLRLLKKLEKLERRYERIVEQAAAAYETDIEVGARLGASYCITDASGPTS